MNDFTTILILLAIAGGGLLARQLVGAAKNINVFKVGFDKEKFINSTVRVALIASTIIGGAWAIAFIISLAERLGMPLTGVEMIDVRAVQMMLMLATISSWGSAVMQAMEWISLKKENIKSIQDALSEAAKDKEKVAGIEVSRNEDDEIEANVKVFDASEFITRDPVIEAQKAFEDAVELVGGIGTIYKVNIESYSAFRADVIGKAFDIDNAYGAQCWDGAGLLWQQIGRSLITGNGLAIGCWDLNRDRNAGNDFELIYDKTQIKRGDVLFFRPNHVAFADADYSGAIMPCLGQNQTGTGNGAPFNVVNINLSGFAGAMRFKKWHTNPSSTPKPSPAPSQSVVSTPVVPNNPVDGEIKVGDSVVAWGSGTADSYGGGAKTRDFPETTMKVIGINNGRYALNQYNSGNAGVVADATGWWPAEQIRK